jgi:membrane AbrB-like protein
VSADQLLLLLALGAAGAGLGWALHLPMWPLTGAILGAVTVHLFGLGGVRAPAWMSTVGQLLVGCAVGSAIGRNLFRAVRRVGATGAVVVAAIVGLGVLIGTTLWLTGLVDPAVGLLGSVPGGVGEMVAVAAGMHADSALVAAMHLVRLVAVLLSLPWLLRWARGWRAER